jgi:hypothetical protein
MTSRIGLVFSVAVIILLVLLLATPAPTCCPAGRSGKPVVNADQTVIILWDAGQKMEHFIRKASFKSEGDDFGFLIPTPTEPELAESGNKAFPYLLKLTEPETKTVSRPRGINCACSKSKSGGMTKAEKERVKVRLEKEVAGFHAVVLETRSATALVKWLKDRGYAFSPEVRAWAKPYIESGWMITAFKVAKDQSGKGSKEVAASALRMSFKTDRPLFPYREPDPKSAAETLNAHRRLLRIYFLADARYEGQLTKKVSWTGQVAWANELTAGNRKQVLELLGLPKDTGPAAWWLTEFEDYWPYRAAPADVYFKRDPNQDTVKRKPIIEYVSSPWPTDVIAFALAGFVVLPPLLRRVRRRGK